MTGLRRALVLTHRWLGIASSLLFAAWFVSGMAMMYSRMPRLSAEERLQRSDPLDVSAVQISATDAARVLKGVPERVRIGMLDGRPVYRLQQDNRWVTVFADSGEQLVMLDDIQAVNIVAAFTRRGAHTLRHDGRIESPDQWTLQLRPLLPMHRVALGDDDETSAYVSEQTGEVVLMTSRTTRLWGYLSAVIHWLYFTPLRQHGALWTQVIIWTSIAGCVLCLSGLVWGFWQFARLGGRTYSGLMRWHHYAGLMFGVVTFTFVFSGLLSMNPWEWSPSTSAIRTQRDTMAGGPLAIDRLTVTRLRAAMETLSREFIVKEIELLQFNGKLYAESYLAPESSASAPQRLSDPGVVLASRIALDHRLVDIAAPGGVPFRRFDDQELSAVARTLIPGVAVSDQTWLTDYDAYYYDRHGALPLPVLRVRFADADETWFYIDPYRGNILRKEERTSRLNRWLYHALHSVDVPWLYRQRPLWDVVVIALSIGGLAVVATSAPAGWRRVRAVVRSSGRRR